MEFYGGGSLRKALDEANDAFNATGVNALSEVSNLRVIMSQLLSALSFCEAQGIVHEHGHEARERAAERQ